MTQKHASHVFGWLIGLWCVFAVSFTEATPQLRPLIRLPSSWQNIQWKRVHPSVAMGWSMQVWRGKTQRISVATTLSALLRTRRALLGVEIQQWQQHGIQFLQEKGHILSSHNIYPIHIHKAEALRWLEYQALVVQVDTHQLPFHRIHSPLRITAQEVQALATHQTTNQNLPITGKGVVIGLIDGGVDVFHPSLFQADGGYFAWVDVDGDKKLTLGVDGIDLNQNGSIDKDEVLRCLHARYYSAFHKTIDPDPNETCRVGQDWLYVDSNGNKQRDYGPKQSFTELDPTYGEPLFVVDDVDRNKRLDLTEKLVGLKTSKIKSVWFKNNTYVRGRDLYRTPVTPLLRYAGHGTLSASVMVGGQRGFSDHLGVAPDAEVVVGVSQGVDASGTPISTIPEALIWMLEQDVQVILHEYSQWLGKFLDGSSNHEKLLETASQKGIIQVTPVGNLGGTGKHMLVDIPVGTTQSYPIEVNWPSWYPPNYPSFRQITLALLWKNKPASDLEFTLIAPNKTRIKLSKTNPRGQGVGTTLVIYSVQSTSSRDTNLLQATLLGYDTINQQFLSLPKGTWTLEVKGDPKQKVELHAYIGDDRSSWQQGVHFVENTSDQYTTCWPSTSDGALGVGAYTGRPNEPYSSTPEKMGEIRKFSSAGPRMDGQQVLWLAAPDNPLAAVSPLKEVGLPEVPFASYLVYGGTSGASPHVAAAVALLKQKHPTWGHNEIKEALRKGALADNQVGSIPNRSWGHGKLRIYQSLYGKAPTPNTPPTIEYVGVNIFFLGNLPDELTVTAKDQESKPEDMRIEWDVGYTGTWKKADDSQSMKFPFQHKGSYLVKSRVFDPQGASASVVIPIQVKVCEKDPDCGSGGQCRDSMCSPDRERVLNDGGVPPEPGEPVGCQCDQVQGFFFPWFVMALLLLGLFRRMRV